jgi:F0F1-type ATP synthase assembly protein I
MGLNHQLASALAQGSQLLVTIAAGVVVGLGADWFFSTAPWLTLVFSMAGLILGCWKLLNPRAFDERPPPSHPPQS